MTKNIKEKTYEFYLTDYHRHVGVQLETSRQMFSHSQEISLMLQKTAVFLNSGAIAVLATLATTNENLLLTLKLPAIVFIIGVIFIFFSCIATYYNLQGHYTLHAYQADKTAIEINKKWFGNDDANHKEQNHSLLTEQTIQHSNKIINLTFYAGLAGLIISYIAFFVGCYYVTKVNF